MSYSVHFQVETPAHFTRLQMVLRLLALVVLGAAGLSLGGLFVLLYLGLPIVAAVRISSHGSGSVYVSKDGSHIVRVLSWLAAVTSWVGLAVERLPKSSSHETVELTIEGDVDPTAQAAALRVLWGLPSLLVLLLLALLGSLLWLVAVISILLFEQCSPSITSYLVGLQRYAYRLLAYQAALVDEPPPLSRSESRGLVSH